MFTIREIRNAELDIPEEFFVREHEKYRNEISRVTVHRTMYEGVRKYTHTHRYKPNPSRLFRGKLAIPSSTSSQQNSRVLHCGCIFFFFSFWKTQRAEEILSKEQSFRHLSNPRGGNDVSFPLVSILIFFFRDFYRWIKVCKQNLLSVLFSWRNRLQTFGKRERERGL